MRTTSVTPRRVGRKMRPLVQEQKEVVVQQAQDVLKEAQAVSHYLTDLDIYLLRQGNHFKLYEKLGAHIMYRDGVPGVLFAVWAPNAEKVSVIGDFNGWNADVTPLHPRWDSSGIWEGFVANIGDGTSYKYAIRTKQGWHLEKSDPFGFHSEVPPKSASIVCDQNYDWKDK